MLIKSCLHYKCLSNGVSKLAMDIHDHYPHSPSIVSSSFLPFDEIILQLVFATLSLLVKTLIILFFFVSLAPEHLFPKRKPPHPLLHEHVLFYNNIFQPCIFNSTQ